MINDSKEGREHDRINGKSFKDRSSPKMGVCMIREKKTQNSLRMLVTK